MPFLFEKAQLFFDQHKHPDFASLLGEDYLP
jgi:hypothetical protein